jgi:hypothetical protein
VSVVNRFFDYAVAFPHRVSTKLPELFGYRVPRLGLLVCGDAGVEDGPLWAPAIS